MSVKRIVIKIGSNALIDRNGFVRYPVISDVIDQVMILKKKGQKVLVVTSGSVALGRSIIKSMPNFLNTNLEDKIAASLGQHMLMKYYQEKISQEKCWCSQILLNKSDFNTRERYLQMMHFFEGLLAQGDIIPIINENDTLARAEDVFIDNDELAGLVASQIRADKLILITNVDGIYDKNPSDPSAKLIEEIEPDSILPAINKKEASVHGRGGMYSKINTALKVAKLGIGTLIMNVNNRNFLSQYETMNLGTKITASKTVSSLKRWLSFSEGVAGVYINQGAADILKSKEQAVSLLPIGIESIYGEFNDNDVIYVMDLSHEVIAIGLSSYSSTELRDYLGQPNKPELIHYNQLYVY